jgi:hypothetical protein
MSEPFTAPLNFFNEGVVVKGRDFTREVVQVLEKRQAKAFNRAERELAAANRAGGERATIRTRDGDGGEVHHVIHPVHAAMLVNKFGTHRCLEDKGVVKDYLKQFPAARVRSRSRKIQVGFRGGQSKFGARITFRKVYS